MALSHQFPLYVSFIPIHYFENKIKSGIDVVRNRIKMFAQKRVTLPPGRHKIIVLDEADRYESPENIMTSLSN